MIELPHEEFISRFECYEKDLEKSNGHRPWEILEKENENVNLNTCSGKVVSKIQEGDMEK